MAQLHVLCWSTKNVSREILLSKAIFEMIATLIQLQSLFCLIVHLWEKVARWTIRETMAMYCRHNNKKSTGMLGSVCTSFVSDSYGIGKKS